MEYDLFAIGKRIADLRKQHGLTQDALGEHLGVTGKQIARIEYGTSSLTPKNYLKVSELFSVSLDYLFKGNLEKPLNDCVVEFVKHASYENQEAVWRFLQALMKLKDT
ncbi:helix-turn-helix domain-containing protein [Neglectibacter caecimuris]|uniref:helix-turn-helix domain-containing protein n=1 Tax=Neglectibacter caecimuris TaxID=3093658 RepID=UPI002AC9D402|nr:helix-turn-helix transcriptional regulator [Neglectibacter sp. M00184]